MAKRKAPKRLIKVEPLPPGKFRIHALRVARAKLARPLFDFDSKEIPRAAQELHNAMPAKFRELLEVWRLKDLVKNGTLEFYLSVGPKKGLDVPDFETTSLAETACHRLQKALRYEIKADLLVGKGLIRVLLTVVEE